MMKPIVIMSVGFLSASLYVATVLGDELLGIDDVTMQVIGVDEVPDDVFEVIPFPRRQGQLIRKSTERTNHEHQGNTQIGPHDDSVMPADMSLPHGISPDGQIISSEEYSNFSPDPMTPPPVDFSANGVIGLPPNNENTRFEPPELIFPEPMDIPMDIDPITGAPMGFDPNLLPPPDLSMPNDPFPMPDPVLMPEPIPMPMPDPNGMLPIDGGPGR